MFYSPFNLRSRDAESVMLAFHAQGHRVLSLTQAKGEFIHAYLKPKGIETYSHVVNQKPGFFYYLKHVLYLVRFCKEHKVDVVYSHLEPANFVASIAQYFIKPCVYICRHHIDEGLLAGYSRSLSYRLTYRLARKIVVVSQHTIEYMVAKEGVPRHKITHINLAYDFSHYVFPDNTVVAQIRQRSGASIVLVTAGRLNAYKRPEQSVMVLKHLVDNGMDARLVLLGTGENEQSIKKMIAANGLTDRVEMPGFINNVLDYLSASDYLLHPSISESSCVVVKEAGLVKKPVIVCNHVGDFEEYIVHGQNGFLVSKENFVEETVKIILESHSKKDQLRSMGEALHKSVYDLFSVQNVIHHYDRLNNCE